MCLHTHVLITIYFVQVYPVNQRSSASLTRLTGDLCGQNLFTFIFTKVTKLLIFNLLCTQIFEDFRFLFHGFDHYCKKNFDYSPLLIMIVTVVINASEKQDKKLNKINIIYRVNFIRVRVILLCILLINNIETAKKIDEKFEPNRYCILL